MLGKKSKKEVIIENPAQKLKENEEKLARYGGFDLLESAIENIQNVNPQRKARKKIFITESSKKEERDELRRTLLIWADVLESSDDIAAIADESEKRSAAADKSLTKNLGIALEATRELEQAYRSVALFYKNTESNKVKNIIIVNAELDQLKDLDNTMFIDDIHE